MSSAFLTGLFLQLSISGSLSQAAYLFTISSGKPGFYPFIFLIYGPLMFIVNALFLRKERKFSAMAAVNVPAAAAVLAAAILVCARFSFWPIFCSVVIVIFLSYCSISLNVKEPSLRAATLSVECAVLVTIVFAALVSFMNANPIWIFPGAIGLACGMISLTLKRIGRIPSLRDIILIAGILIIVFTLALIFVIFAAAPAGNGLIYISSLIVQGVKQIGRLIGSFFNWLSSFAKGESSAPIEMGSSSSASDFNSEEVLQEGPYGLIAVIAAVIIAVVIIVIIIKLIRRHRFVGAVSISGQTIKKAGQRPTLKEAIKKMLAKRKLNRAKKKYLKEHADTPLGIYYSLELRFRRGKNRKLSGETPREYILRLNSIYKSSDVYSPDNNNLFENLADSVDMEMYSYSADSRCNFPQAKILADVMSKMK